VLPRGSPSPSRALSLLLGRPKKTPSVKIKEKVKEVAKVPSRVSEPGKNVTRGRPGEQGSRTIAFWKGGKNMGGSKKNTATSKEDRRLGCTAA